MKRKANIKRIILGIAVLLFLVSTLFPKNSVRTTMLLTGASPVSVIKCNPEYLGPESKYYKTPVYMIPMKYGYTPLFSNALEPMYTFKIQRILFIFNFAIPTFLDTPL
ncbi:hypothetical protein PL11_004340 [Lentilactobacillus curieae]|uniref:Uncharacterized protein n=1 Tax=Lentilactobacillus curieae TaxID=1138822 RepID=A0A1S6QHX5_9LACO|nr:hypothetical protein [Lentilactobacillus curieae]AQW21206.1 hypothetical protein PL11_004340 [Lentilactobacillus curieae]